MSKKRLIDKLREYTTDDLIKRIRHNDGVDMVTRQLGRLSTGAWRVAERGNVYVVVEVYPRAAYAYLWDKSKGVLSHVWLFNCAATVTEDDSSVEADAPPEMCLKKSMSAFIRHPRLLTTSPAYTTSPTALGTSTGPAERWLS